MRKKERTMWKALDTTVELIISSQAVIDKILNVIDTLVADIGLMDARMEMMEVRIKEMEKR